MKIFFLDIDGVLLSGGVMLKEGTIACIPLEPMTLLNDVCHRTGCFVVVSSTWRRDHDCREKLVAAGFKGTFHRDWRTPLEGAFRGDQIRAWLASHPGVSRYAIIDDQIYFHNEQMSRLIRTDFMVGMTQADAEHAILLLGETDLQRL